MTTHQCTPDTCPTDGTPEMWAEEVEMMGAGLDAPAESPVDPTPDPHAPTSEELEEAAESPCPTCGKPARACSWWQNPTIGRGDCCTNCRHDPWKELNEPLGLVAVIEPREDDLGTCPHVVLKAGSADVYTWPIDDLTAKYLGANPRALYQFVHDGLGATWHVNHGPSCGFVPPSQ